jgi:hypothetical protein
MARKLGIVGNREIEKTVTELYTLGVFVCNISG